MAIEFMKPPPSRPDPTSAPIEAALDWLTGDGLAVLVCGAVVLVLAALAVRTKRRPRLTEVRTGGEGRGALRRDPPRPWDEPGARPAGPRPVAAVARSAKPAKRPGRGLAAAFGAATPSRGECRWRQDKRRHPSINLKRWTCTTCGVEAYSADGSPPKECKRALRDARL